MYTVTKPFLIKYRPYKVGQQLTTFEYGYLKRHFFFVRNNIDEYIHLKTKGEMAAERLQEAREKKREENKVDWSKINIDPCLRSKDEEPEEETVKEEPEEKPVKRVGRPKKN